MEGLDGAQAASYVRDRLLRAGADPDIFDDAEMVRSAAEKLVLS